MFELLSMMRLHNCLMAAIGTFIGGIIIEGPAFSHIEFLGLAMVAAFLITGAGNVINDCIDVDADKVNKPKRPIPLGKISRRSATAYSLFLFLAGIIIAGFINWVTFLIAIFNSLLLIGYSSVLQDKLLIGNVTVGYLTGSTFLFGGLSLGFFDRITLPLILMGLAMLSTISREIVKDLEDKEGDRMRFLKKIAQDAKLRIAERFSIGKHGIQLRYGEDFLLAVAVSTLALAIILSSLPYYYGIVGRPYLAIVFLADVVFFSCIYSLGRRNKKKGYARISRRMKYGMILALIAFVAGVFL